MVFTTHAMLGKVKRAFVRWEAVGLGGVLFREISAKRKEGVLSGLFIRPPLPLVIGDFLSGEGSYRGAGEDKRKRGRR